MKHIHIPTIDELMQEPDKPKKRDDTLTGSLRHAEPNGPLSSKNILMEIVRLIEINVHNAIIKKYGSKTLDYEQKKFWIRKLWTPTPYCGMEISRNKQKEIFIDYSSLIRRQDGPVKIQVYNGEQEDLARDLQERFQGFIGTEITLLNYS